MKNESMQDKELNDLILERQRSRHNEKLKNYLDEYPQHFEIAYQMYCDKWADILEEPEALWADIKQKSKK
jgi:hypothetical protein